MRSTATVDVRDDAVLASEAHAIAADSVGAGHGNGEAGFPSRTEGWRFDGRAAAAKKSPVVLEHEHHGRHAIQRPAGGRIPDDTTHDQSIAVALVTERDELDRHGGG